LTINAADLPMFKLATGFRDLMSSCQCHSNNKHIDKNINDHIKQLTLYLIRQLNIQFLKKAFLLQQVKDDLVIII
jgi:hypothetical protein